MSYINKTLIGSLLLSTALGAQAADTPRTGNEVEAHVGALIDNMTLSEQINFTRVDDGHMIPPVAKFGIPGTTAYDSSMGLFVNNTIFGASFPAQSALAATWNVNRAKEFGLAIGYEGRMAGGQQVLTPTVNLYRTPFNGRAAESVCGEDPYLCSVMAPAIANGVQRQGIQAGAKHLLANEQEANRHNVNINVSEQAMRDIYLQPFESLAKNANIAAMMCGFNKVNGEFSCENHHILTDIIKGEWGYKGFIMSDFNSIQNAFEGAWAGTDMDMPSGLQFTTTKLMPYVQSGALDRSVIKDKDRRLMRALVSYGFDKAINQPQPLDHPEYGETAALDIAREGIVLLKNSDTEAGNPLLPLKKSAKIAVIGNYAQNAPSSPFGTAWNIPDDNYVTELNGLQQLAKSGDDITFIKSMALDPVHAVYYRPDSCHDGICTKGVKAEYFTNDKLQGDPSQVRYEDGINFDWVNGTNTTAEGAVNTGLTVNNGAFSARYSAIIKPTVTGPHAIKVRASGPFKVILNGDKIMDSDGVPRADDEPNAVVKTVKTKRLKAGKDYSLVIEFERTSQRFQTNLGGLDGLQVSWASLVPPKSIEDYDAVVAVVGNNYETEGETADKHFEIPDQQGFMLKKLTKANPNTIVVMHAGGGMKMLPWAKNAGAILHAWYSGQYGGQALAEILYGKVNPSGKLPITLDRKIKLNPSYASYHDPDDYVGDNAKTEMTYSEGLLFGYRGYQKEHKKPLYPFGFGLSYTHFDYSDLKLSSNLITEGKELQATFTITNSGDRDGYETAELYVKPANVASDEPIRTLKGFKKVYLKAGESQQVTINLNNRAFSHYVQNTDTFDVTARRYVIQVGGSSDDLPLKQRVRAPYAISLHTNDSNMLSEEMQQKVQVPLSAAY